MVREDIDKLIEDFGSNEFEVTEEHIQLLRDMVVTWWNCEFGAPAIDPKRPYGNSWVYGDIAETLKLEPDLFKGSQLNVRV